MRFNSVSRMKDYSAAHASIASMATIQRDDPTSTQHEKHSKQWSLQRSYLQCRRLPFLIQCIIILVFVYVLSWAVSLVFISASDSSEEFIDAAIIVLGGGVAADGTVPKHTQLRIDEAVRVYRSLQGRARIFPLSGGTPYKPNPLDADGFPIWEATAAAKALLQKSIPADRIFEEAFSLDTIGNAYWLRTVHIHPGKYRDVYVITNDWHMPRTQAIFSTVFSLPDVDPRKTRSTTSSHNAEEFDSLDYYLPHLWMYHALYYVLSALDVDTAMTESVRLHFLPVDAGIDDPTIVSARQQKEEKSLTSFLTHVAPNWRTLYDLHVWLFSEHNAYAAKRLIQKENREDKHISSLSKEEQLLMKTY